MRLKHGLMNPPRLAVPKAASLAVATLLLATGCGWGSGISRYTVKGNVAFQGQAVPDGQIAFEPDAKAGNAGPASYGQIRSGQYRIARDRGHVGGAYVVRVNGFEATDPAREGGPPPKTLFLDYEIRVELPKAAATLDVDVPSPHYPKR